MRGAWEAKGTATAGGAKGFDPPPRRELRRDCVPGISVSAFFDHALDRLQQRSPALFEIAFNVRRDETEQALPGAQERALAVVFGLQFKDHHVVHGQVGHAHLAAHAQEFVGFDLRDDRRQGARAVGRLHDPLRARPELEGVLGPFAFVRVEAEPGVGVGQDRPDFFGGSGDGDFLDGLEAGDFEFQFLEGVGHDRSLSKKKNQPFRESRSRRIFMLPRGFWFLRRRGRGGRGRGFGSIANVEQRVGEHFFPLRNPAPQDFPERDRVQAIPALASVAGDQDQAGAVQDAQVLHHGEAREPGEGFGEFTGGAWPLGE